MSLYCQFTHMDVNFEKEASFGPAQNEQRTISSVNEDKMSNVHVII